MASPVFTRNQNFQTPQNHRSGHQLPVAGLEGVMTVENALQKTIITFTVLLVAAGVGWFIPVLALPALIVGFVLGLVNAFKKEPSAPLILAYAVAEGLAIGGLSGIMEQQESGIVSQAVIGTLCVVGVVLFLYKTGIVKATPKMTKIFLIAMLGYLVFSLVNLGLQMTGVVSDPWGLHSSLTVPGTSIPLGIALGVFAVLLGSYSLVMDFTFIDNGVANRLPEKYGWTAAFGITVTVVWLYVEILRMLAIARR
jgi:uncharacterized YccA/Bax inhibitor family protein